MKYIKHLLCILIIPFIINSSINVSADSDAYKKHKNLYDETCETYFENIKKDESLKKYGIIVDENDPEYNLKYIYKRSYLVGNIAETYKSGTSIAEMLRAEHNYWVFSTSNGNVIIRITEHVSESISFAPKNPEINYKVDFSIVESALETLGSNFEDENLIVRCITFLPYYHLGEVVYINLSGKEYFIHFSNNSKLSGFENGKLYKIDKLIERIDEIEKRVAKEEAIENGTYKDINYYLPYIIGCGCVLIIASTTVILLVIRNKKKQKTINTET